MLKLLEYNLNTSKNAKISTDNLYMLACILLEPDSGFDFKLDSFIAGPCETFDPHYGVGGYNGDGDITNPDNLEEFQSYVLQNTDGTGVHFVMADGVSFMYHINDVIHVFDII